MAEFRNTEILTLATLLSEILRAFLTFFQLEYEAIKFFLILRKTINLSGFKLNKHHILAFIY